VEIKFNREQFFKKGMCSFVTAVDSRDMFLNLWVGRIRLIILMGIESKSIILWQNGFDWIRSK
ncbi:MAG TPA: hypothetical protein VKR58_02895, partial [Aquella sp.]|nr:hypothetical protein [Aquella sp.]